MNTLFFKFAMPFVFIIMTVFFNTIAIKTLVGCRPLMLSCRWLFAFMCLACLPIIAISIRTGVSSSNGNSTVAWIHPLMLAVLLIFSWIQMKGYMAFAISDTYFREALLASAASLGFSIEETMSHLRIKETGVEMQVAIQGWMGTAQLKSSGKGSDDAVRQIAEGMIKYFQSTPGKMNYIASYFHLVFGAILVAMTVWVLTH